MPWHFPTDTLETSKHEFLGDSDPLQPISNRSDQNLKLGTRISKRRSSPAVSCSMIRGEGRGIDKRMVFTLAYFICWPWRPCVCEHRVQAHLRTQIWLTCAHRSQASSAHTNLAHLRTQRLFGDSSVHTHTFRHPLGSNWGGLGFRVGTGV